MTAVSIHAMLKKLRIDLKKKKSRKKEEGMRLFYLFVAADSNILVMKKNVNKLFEKIMKFCDFFAFVTVFYVITEKLCERSIFWVFFPKNRIN